MTLSPLLTAVTVALALNAPATARVTDRYISPTGDDANPCTQTLPCRTWARADDLLTQPGDTLYVRGGVYVGQAGTWQGASGTGAEPVTIRNYPGETPVFDGRGSESSFMVVAGGRDHTVIEGLTVQNYKGSSGIWIGYDPLTSDDAVGNVIRGMTFRSMGDHPSLEHAIYPSYGNRELTIEGNRIFDTSGAAIHGWHGPGVQGARVADNLIVGATWGILFADGARDVRIEHNTVVDVAAECIRISASGEGETGDRGNYGSVVRHNIAVRCAGVGSRGATNPTIADNHFHAAAASGLAATTGDPRFAGACDYSLPPGSPAAGKGVSAGTAKGGSGCGAGTGSG